MYVMPAQSLLGRKVKLEDGTHGEIVVVHPTQQLAQGEFGQYLHHAKLWLGVKLCEDGTMCWVEAKDRMLKLMADTDD